MFGLQPQSVGRVPRPGDAIAVALSGLHLGQVAVPDVAVDLGELDALLGHLPPRPDIDQAELDLVGHLAEQGEVGAAAVEGRAERVGLARPRLGGASLHGSSSLRRACGTFKLPSAYPPAVAASASAPVRRELLQATTPSRTRRRSAVATTRSR